MHYNKSLMALVAGAASLAATQAATINTELALLIDGSGSMSAPEFALQKNGYLAALASEVPTDGTVAIGVWQFGTAVSSVFPTTIIGGAGDLNNLLAAITAMNQSGGNTALGPAIQTASLDLNNANGIDSLRQIIDVSTDGVGNITPPTQTDARDAALLNGIEQINGIGVGGGANLNFVGGVNSFGIQVNSFDDFAPAIASKLRVEIGRVPDAGSTLALTGLAMLGLFGMRRFVRA